MMMLPNGHYEKLPDPLKYYQLEKRLLLMAREQLKPTGP
jgi:hypothetical protein